MRKVRHLSHQLFYNFIAYKFLFSHFICPSILPSLQFSLVKEIKSSKMERPLDDSLLVILKKVASSSAKNFFKLRATSVRLRRLAKNKEVLRVLSRNCLSYFLTANLAQKNKPSYDKSLAVVMQRLAWHPHLESFNKGSLNWRISKGFCMKQSSTAPTGLIISWWWWGPSPEVDFHQMKFSLSSNTSLSTGNLSTVERQSWALITSAN